MISLRANRSGWAGGVALVLCTALWACASPLCGDTAPVAVMDFTMAGAASPDSWASGMAELLEVELAANGVPVVERRHIRLLLGERRLTRQGLLGPSELRLRTLPHVRFLVEGQVTKTAEKRFQCEAALVEAPNALETARVSVSGRYPDEWADCVRQLAALLTAKLAAGASTGPAAQVTAATGGVSLSPEVMAHYYRGLEHLHQGRPGYALFYLRRAATNDEQCLAAVVWQQRIYERLGLPELAVAVRDMSLDGKVGRNPTAAKFLAALSGTEVPRTGRTWLVYTTGDVHAEFLDEFRTELASAIGVSVFRPDSLDSVAREQDLDLTREFHALPPGFWRQALPDHAVVLTATATGGRIHLADAINGRQVVPPVDFAGASGGAAARLLVEALNRDDADHAPTPTAPVTEGLTSSEVSLETGTDADRFALRFDRFLATPDRLEAILPLQADYSRSVHIDLAVTEQLLQRALRVVRQEPERDDAPLWLMSILVQLRTIHRIAVTTSGMEPMETAFGELLERYPRSFPAHLVRYMLAHKRADEGKHVEAAALFNRIADEMPPDQWYGAYPRDRFWINLHCFRARELVQIGRVEDAEKAVLAAQPWVEKRYPAASPVLPTQMVWPFYGDRQGAFSCIYMPAYPDVGGGKSLQGVNDICPVLEQLHRDILDRRSGRVTAPNGDSQNLYERALAADGPAAVEHHFQSLEQFTREFRPSDPLLDRVNRQLAWLYPRLPDQAAVARFERLETALLALPLQPDERCNLLMHCGRFAEAEPVLADLAQSHLPWQRFDAIMRTCEVLYFTGRQSRIAPFLRDSLQPFAQLMADDAWARLPGATGPENVLRRHHAPELYPRLVLTTVRHLVEVDRPADALSLYRSIADSAAAKSAVPVTPACELALKFEAAKAMFLEGDILPATDLIKDVIVATADKDTAYPGCVQPGIWDLHALALHRLEQFRTYGAAQSGMRYFRTAVLPDLPFPRRIAVPVYLSRVWEQPWMTANATALKAIGEELLPYAYRVCCCDPTFPRAGESIWRDFSGWQMVGALSVLPVRDTLDVPPFFPLLTQPSGPLATAAFLTRNRAKTQDALPALLLAAAKQQGVEDISRYIDRFPDVTPGTMPPLLELLDHPNPQVQANTVSCLRKYYAAKLPDDVAKGPEAQLLDWLRRACRDSLPEQGQAAKDKP